MNRASNYSSTGRRSDDTASDNYLGERNLELTPSDENDERQVRGASTSTSSPEVFLFDDESITVVKANKKESQHDRRLVLGGGPENDIVGPVNVACVDGKPPFGKQKSREVSVSSATDTTIFSESNSEPGYESSEITTASQNDVFSEAQPGGSVTLTFEEANRDLIQEAVEVQDGSSYGTSLEAIHQESEVPTIKSWSAPAVEKSEIPLRASKAPKSEISDLGNSAFYDRIAARRKSSPTAEIRQNLSLQDQIFKGLVRLYSERKGFFPRALLSELVTKDCVIQELSQSLKSTHSVRQIQELAESICEERLLPTAQNYGRQFRIKSFKRIFAILVLIERSSTICKFVVDDVNDSNLPLIKYPGGTNESLFELRMEINREKRLECFDDWTPFYLNAFEEWQWTTVSPFFYKGTDKEVHHFPLHASIMLPFTADSRRDGGSDSQYAVVDGGFSRVFKANIHPDHHDIIENISPHTQKYQFAIKRLHSQSKADFKKEVEMLKRFSYGSHRHRNLIALLATYEQRGVYYLIFPCAGGDLNQFWKVNHPKPSFELETITWVAEQCEGIAEGLLSIHRYEPSDSKASNREKGYGRHGDLKPENILWFPDAGRGLGVLKISDFGLASFSTRHSRSYVNNNSVAASMCYRAPEWDLTDGKIGQSYDIWTLGCLYLEFTTWLLGGMELVNQFSDNRMLVDPGWYGCQTDNFFMLYRPVGSRDIAAMVKPPVTKFIKELHDNELCSEFLHDLLTMIEFDMLLVKPNNPVQRSRINAQTVYSKLAAMLKKVLDDPIYGDKPAPWPHQTDSSQQRDEPAGMSVAEVQYLKMSQHCAIPVQDETQHQMLAVPSMRPREGR